MELTMEQHCRVLEAMFDNFELLTEEDQKTLANIFIERIEIFPNREEHGRWLKYVRFQFPLELNGSVLTRCGLRIRRMSLQRMIYQFPTQANNS